MFTLLTQRIAPRLVTLSAWGGITRACVATVPAPISFQTRRTFLAGTPALSFAPAAAKKEKTAAKKPTKRAAKKTGAKKASPTKAKATLKKKSAVKKPTRIKLTESDMPPATPKSSFLLFFGKYLKEQPKATSLVETQQHAKSASALWKTLSDAEKQPFVDEAAATMATYKLEKEAFFDTTSKATLSEINKLRKKRGKSRIRAPTEPEDRKPAGAFFRYLQAFRNSSGFAKENPGKLAAAEAGRQWRTMSNAEKAPYEETYKKEMAEWRAKRQVST